MNKSFSFEINFLLANINTGNAGLQNGNSGGFRRRCGGNSSLEGAVVHRSDGCHCGHLVGGSLDGSVHGGIGVMVIITVGGYDDLSDSTAGVDELSDVLGLIPLDENIFDLSAGLIKPSPGGCRRIAVDKNVDNLSAGDSTMRFGTDPQVRGILDVSIGLVRCGHIVAGDLSAGHIERGFSGHVDAADVTIDSGTTGDLGTIGDSEGSVSTVNGPAFTVGIYSDVLQSEISVRIRDVDKSTISKGIGSGNGEVTSVDGKFLGNSEHRRKLDIIQKGDSGICGCGGNSSLEGAVVHRSDGCHCGHLVGGSLDGSVHGGIGVMVIITVGGYDDLSDSTAGVDELSDVLGLIPLDENIFDLSAGLIKPSPGGCRRIAVDKNVDNLSAGDSTMRFGTDPQVRGILDVSIGLVRCGHIVAGDLSAGHIERGFSGHVDAADVTIDSGTTGDLGTIGDSEGSVSTVNGPAFTVGIYSDVLQSEISVRIRDVDKSTISKGIGSGNGEVTSVDGKFLGNSEHRRKLDIIQKGDSGICGCGSHRFSKCCIICSPPPLDGEGGYTLRCFCFCAGSIGSNLVRGCDNGPREQQSQQQCY